MLYTLVIYDTFGITLCKKKKIGFGPCKIKILQKIHMTPITQQYLLRGADVYIYFHFFFIGYMYISFTSYLIKKNTKNNFKNMKINFRKF